jgi:anti-sigma regulatory factor (Ser/Thr protein kinase)
MRKPGWFTAKDGCSRGAHGPADDRLPGDSRPDFSADPVQPGKQPVRNRPPHRAVAHRDHRAHQPAPTGAAMSGGTGAVTAGRGAAFPASAELGVGAGTAFLSWPLVSGLEFGALPSAVGCGRAHTRQVLHEWGLQPLTDDAELLVSELLTNALHASWTLEVPAPIALRLLADDHRLIIEAWDRCIEKFDLDAQSPNDDEHGRGLAVVTTLSTRWGVRRPSYSFKAVWCELVVSTSA